MYNPVFKIDGQFFYYRQYKNISILEHETEVSVKAIIFLNSNWMTKSGIFSQMIYLKKLNNKNAIPTWHAC